MRLKSTNSAHSKSIKKMMASSKSLLTPSLKRLTDSSSMKSLRKVIIIEVVASKLDDSKMAERKEKYKIIIKWKQCDKYHLEKKIDFEIPNSSYTGLSFPYNGPNSKDILQLSVMEEGSDICSAAWTQEIMVKDLLGEIIAVTRNSLQFSIRQFSLYYFTVEIGSISLQSNYSTLILNNFDTYDAVSYIDPKLFLLPVSPIGVSGGTAAFYKLVLKSPEKMNNQSSNHFIGKNSDHAEDEISFYVGKTSLCSNFETATCNIYLRELLKFTFEYAGILKASEDNESIDETSLELLVIRNLYDGKKKTAFTRSKNRFFNS